MKSFQNWCENFSSLNEAGPTVATARQDLANDRKQFGIAWQGPEEAKNIIELLAKYDPQAASQIVQRLKREANNLRGIIDAGGDQNDIELIDRLTGNIRVMMNRYAAKASATRPQAQPEQAPPA